MDAGAPAHGERYYSKTRRIIQAEDLNDSSCFEVMNLGEIENEDPHRGVVGKKTARVGANKKLLGIGRN